MLSLPRDSGLQGRETIGPGGPLLSPSDTGRPAPGFLPGGAIKGGTGGGVELELSGLFLSRRKGTKQVTKSAMGVRGQVFVAVIVLRIMWRSQCWIEQMSVKNMEIVLYYRVRIF